jgi:hypothetical protein
VRTSFTRSARHSFDAYPSKGSGIPQHAATATPVVDWVLAELRALSAAYDFDIGAAVPRDLLTARPPGAENSIAWLSWHLARCEDVAINAVVRGEPQVLHSNGWAGRLGISDARIGTGFSPQDVRRIEDALDIGALAAYASTVRASTVSWLETTPPLDVIPNVDERLAMSGSIVPAEGAWILQEWTGKPARYFLRTVLIAHGYMHLGEMRSIRGRLGINGL